MLDIKKRVGFLLLSVFLLLMSNRIYAGDKKGQIINRKVISGKIIFSGYINGSWQIWSIDPDGSNLTQITQADQDVHSPSWSHDGNKLSYASSDGKIRILEKGKNTRLVPTPSVKCSKPSWSPDGLRIAFVCFSFTNGQEGSDLWIAETEGDKVYKLLDIPGIQKDPEWSPDGNLIIYTTGYWAQSDELKEELWLIDTRNMLKKQLILNEASNTQPSWSPDGERIAFASDQSGNMEIWVVNRNGENARQLTHNKAYDADPCWSPDGERICFVSTREGKMDIWIIDKDGMNERKVTNVSGADCKDPFWK